VRKSAGLDISDRIHLWWAADGELAAAVREHAELIAAEVLAVALREEEPTSTAPVSFRDAELGLTVWLERAAAQGATPPRRAGS
jgi:isoleucyl-tRNA synthetase